MAKDNPIILIITDNTHDQINGVVTTFINLEKQAILDGYLIRYLNPSNFLHINAPGYSDVKLSLPVNIGRKILAINPDYIHIATEGPIGFAAKLWLDKNKLRYNTSYHTKFPEFMEKIYRIPKSITYRYLRWFHKHSGTVLTTTKTMVNELYSNSFYGNIIPWTRGVDRTVFCPTKTTSDYLLCVSRISKEKNLDDFCKLDYPYKILVGDGPYLTELKRKSYPGMIFLGKKTGKELAKLYQEAMVFVFPSKADTFGIVMIESMACGTPVAAYPVTGPIDVIEQNKTGYMHSDLSIAVEYCKKLNRKKVLNHSKKWTWGHCWAMFKENLIEK